MMLNRMQQESLKSEKRLRRNRHPKLTQNNSFNNSLQLTTGSPVQHTITTTKQPQMKILPKDERWSTQF